MFKKSIQAFNNLITKFITPKTITHAKTSEKKVQKKKIVERTNGNIQKLIIDKSFDVNFLSLKKEIDDFYSNLGFNEIAYDRENAYILKKQNDIEPYVSLRFQNDEYIIEIKSSEKINLKILTN